MILFKHRDVVLATQMVNSDDDLSLRECEFPFPHVIKFRELESDFIISVEVYAVVRERLGCHACDSLSDQIGCQLATRRATRANLLFYYLQQTRREKLTHESKYHIKTEASKMHGGGLRGFFSTLFDGALRSGSSSGGKGPQTDMTSLALTSPGGPSSVRQSCFGIVGHYVLSLKTIGEAASGGVCMLNQVPSTSPLSGRMSLSVTFSADIQMDYQGFLTIFSELHGYQAWQRRWCRIRGHVVKMWKFPEDPERNPAVPPVLEIDLRRALDAEVRLLRQSEIARVNTFELNLLEEGDGTGVADPGDRSVVCYKLSTDTREERFVWCDRLNAVLRNIRAWNMQIV